MKPALRLVSPPPSTEAGIRDTLARLDRHRAEVRTLEAALARLARTYADDRGEFMLPAEARLRREVL